MTMIQIVMVLACQLITILDRFDDVKLSYAALLISDQWTCQGNGSGLCLEQVCSEWQSMLSCWRRLRIEVVVVRQSYSVCAWLPLVHSQRGGLVMCPDWLHAERSRVSVA